MVTELCLAESSSNGCHWLDNGSQGALNQASGMELVQVINSFSIIANGFFMIQQRFNIYFT
jgi:hypothetical protein